MAVKSLEEVLGSLSADEKKLLENTLTKNPELKEGWMRQDDYSRKSNELKVERDRIKEDLDLATQMREWADVNVPRYNKLVEAGIVDGQGNELWTAQKTTLEEQLAEARKQSVGGDMDPAELDKRVRDIVRENGGVTPEELKALINSEGKKLAEETITAKLAEKETEFNEKTIPFVAGFSTGMAIAAGRYEKETGKAFTADDQKAVFDLMAKEKNFDPYKVMDEYIKPHKTVKEAEAEIARRVAEELAKAKLPGGGGEAYIPQNQEKGNLQLMMERSAGEGDFETLIQSQAGKAAEALRTGK